MTFEDFKSAVMDTGFHIDRDDPEVLLPVWEKVNNNWQPVETSIKDGTRILAYDLNGQVFITWYYQSPYYQKQYPNIETGWTSDSCQDFGGWECPLGWMPLPEPPK
jgi:hypothetical protein